MSVGKEAGAGGGERFILTLVFSFIAHGILLLGLGFAAPRSGPATPTLEVILVSTATVETPDQPDYLAQVSQEGGGDLEEKARPTAPASAPEHRPVTGEAEQTREIGTPQPRPERTAPVVTTRGESQWQLDREPPRPETEQPLPEAPERNLVQEEIARLAAERDQATQAYARRPRRKFISAQTREYAYAAYMRAWVARVERVGNLNYPQEARDRQLHDDLILTVAIRRDGSVESIDVVKPSRYRALDDAAIQIVRMSAPFNRLPDDKDDPVDILHITRTWQFLPGDVLRHR